MSRTFTSVILSALAWLSAGLLFAQAEPTPGVVTVEISPEEVTVGDLVSATVTLVWEGEPPTEAPRFPAWQESWGKAEIAAAGEIESFVDQRGRQVYRQSLTLRAFETGEFDLPPVQLAVPMAGQTFELETPASKGFQIRSVLPEEGTEQAPLEPKPAAPLEALPKASAFPLAAAILLLANLLAAGLLLRRARRAAEVQGPARRFLLPPIESLREQLNAIDPTQGPEPCHIALSAALREYFGRRLGFQAMESTTSEIQRTLRSGPAPPALAQRAVRLLRSCDQVKFAREQVGEEALDDRLLRARALGEELETALTPKPEPNLERAA